MCAECVPRIPPAALLESANNPPAVNGALDPARSLDPCLCRRQIQEDLFSRTPFENQAAHCFFFFFSK